MSRKVVVLLLVLLLPVGAVAIAFLNSVVRPRYSDSGAGEFYGSVTGYFSGAFNDESVPYDFHFEGTSKRAWRWANPGNYQYSTLELEWETSGRIKGHGTLDLSTFIISTASEIIALETAEDLQELLSGEEDWHKPVPQDEAEALYGLLVSANEGTLPRPRHHYHRFEEFDGHISHFSLGTRIPYALIAWPLIWLAIVIFVATKKRRLSIEETTSFSEK
jgi:hypothetical protein